MIVHELAHQWAGDSLSVHNWRDIWLNEGFATYAEWLWAEREGRAHGAGRRSTLRMRTTPGRRPLLDAEDRRSRAARTCSTRRSTSAAR